MIIAVGGASMAGITQLNARLPVTPVGFSLPSATSALDRYLDAASYEVRLPELHPDESWFTVSHRVDSGVVSGDLRIEGPSSLVHIWQSDIPPHLFGPYEDPVLAGTPVVIQGVAWSRVDRVLADPGRIQVGTRTPDGITIAIDGPSAAVYDVAARILS